MLKAHMQKRWLPNSAMVGVFLICNSVLGVLPVAAQRDITLRTNKIEYAPAETVFVKVTGGYGLEIKKPALWLTSAGKRAIPGRFINLNVKALVHDYGARLDHFTAPAPGIWGLELHDMSKGDVVSEETYITRVRFHVSARRDTDHEAASPSTAKYLWMVNERVNPYAVMLGDRFTVRVALHVPAANEQKQRASLAWGIGSWWTWEELETDEFPDLPDVLEEAGKAEVILSLRAPCKFPGNYELKLYYGDKVVDVLPVQVIAGPPPCARGRPPGRSKGSFPGT